MEYKQQNKKNVIQGIQMNTANEQIIKMQEFHHFSIISAKYERTNEVIVFYTFSSLGYPLQPSEELLQDLIKMWKRNIPVGSPLLEIMPSDCLEIATEDTEEQAYHDEETVTIIEAMCKVTN